MRRHGRRYKELLPARGSDRSIVIRGGMEAGYCRAGMLIHRLLQLGTAAIFHLKVKSVCCIVAVLTLHSCLPEKARLRSSGTQLGAKRIGLASIIACCPDLPTRQSRQSSSALDIHLRLPLPLSTLLLHFCHHVEEVGLGHGCFRRSMLGTDARALNIAAWPGRCEPQHSQDQQQLDAPSNLSRTISPQLLVLGLPVLMCGKARSIRSLVLSWTVGQVLA